MQQSPNPLRTLVAYHAILVVATFITIMMFLNIPPAVAGEQSIAGAVLLWLTMVTAVFFLLAIVALYAYNSRALPSKSKNAYFNVAVLIELVYVFVTVWCITRI